MVHNFFIIINKYARVMNASANHVIKEYSKVQTAYWQTQL